MIKIFVMTALCALGTLLLGATVIFDEPPAFIAYGLGILNGASIVGVIAIWLIRHNSTTENFSPTPTERKLP